MRRSIEDILKRLVKKSLLEYSLSPTENKTILSLITFEIPRAKNYGDFSLTIALRLSRILKRSSLDIAKFIVDSLKKEIARSAFLKDRIERIQIDGPGFINFFFKVQYFHEILKKVVSKKDKFGRSPFGTGEKVLLEFVSANPTGPLSVAHARQAAVGDVLANILNFCGFKVKREYYLNDEGNQINILGRSIELRLKELAGEKIEFPLDYYQGEYIYEIAEKIKNQSFDKLRMTLKRSRMGQKFPPTGQAGEFKNFSEFGVEYILDIIKKELDDFGIKFDYWYSQKELRKSGKIKKTLGFLKKKGFLYEKDQAIWFRSSQFKDDKDRVVVKSDGTYTYLAPDIAYHQDKFKRGFIWLINLWGPDHHGYINRLKAAVEALGKNPDTLSIIIVQLASIFREGKPMQMSTRKGQYITLREVLNEVGLDAARFFFLMRRTSSHLDFDLELAKKHSPENPVYYIQYAYARISSILRNAKLPMSRSSKGKVFLSLLKESEEIELIKVLSYFPYTLELCLKALEPYYLTEYLQELATRFHKFYDRYRVLGEDKQLTQARLFLAKAARIVIENGLRLLGISRPESM